MPQVIEALKESLVNPDIKETDGYHRLLAAGVVKLTRDNKVAFSCELYRRYLGGHIAA